MLQRLHYPVLATTTYFTLFSSFHKYLNKCIFSCNHNKASNFSKQLLHAQSLVSDLFQIFPALKILLPLIFRLIGFCLFGFIFTTSASSPPPIWIRISIESHSRPAPTFSPARSSNKSYHPPLCSLFLPYSLRDRLACSSPTSQIPRLIYQQGITPLNCLQASCTPSLTPVAVSSLDQIKHYCLRMSTGVETEFVDE